VAANSNRATTFVIYAEALNSDLAADGEFDYRYPAWQFPTEPASGAEELSTSQAKTAAY
jgi:hypothetical protein